MARRYLTLTITSDHAGKTVDTLLRRVLHLSGTAVKSAKRDPCGILLDGYPAFVNASVSLGQTLRVLVGDAEGSPLRPTPGSLALVYEDEDLLVADKPPGVAVHPGPGDRKQTLANWVSWHYQQLGLTAAYHPVNRLDRGTSGLLVIAKHAHAHHRLTEQLHTAAFCRTYLAICEGIPQPLQGTVDLPIGRIGGQSLRRGVVPDGAPAVTHYQVLKTGQGRSLVSLQLETGRTHQIRVHMAALGCPLTGDFLYGAEHPALPRRFALHAVKAAFLHPITGERLCLSSPLPPDLSALLTPFAPSSQEESF